MHPPTFRRLLRWVAWAALVCGVLCLVVAIIYFSTPARSLPTVLGRIRTSDHRTRRAVAWTILAGTLFLVAISARVAGRPKELVD